jgi:hypothetical protein
VILAVSCAVYLPYALRPVPPGGGSALGLTFGIVGFAFMVFVTLLSLGRSFPSGGSGGRRRGCAGISGWARSVCR